MTSERDWDDLKRTFLESLAVPAADSRGKWIEVWRTLIEHPCFQAQLERAAARIARDGPDRSWREDVMQEAMLLLARNLKRAPDLRLDRTRPDSAFAGWMRTILANLCRDALRRLRRDEVRTVRLPGHALARNDHLVVEAWTDLKLTIDSLDEPERAALRLYDRGLSVLEISQALGVSLGRAYRALRDGRERLEQRLLGDEDR